MFFRTILFITFIFFLWLGGLAWFSETMVQEPVRSSGHADAIIVLTGGNSRIAEGLHLLAQGKADQLLISGVNPGASLKAIVKASGYHKKVLAEKISLDYQAKSTIGNAQKAVNWIQENNIQSFFLVTANYHMRRALLEFQQRLKDVKIIPHGVNPLDPVCTSWCKDYNVFCLYMNEYNKYLWSLARFAIREVYLALGA